MSLELNEEVWLTLMHELQSFVRYQLEKPETMAEVRNLMAPANPGRFSPQPRIAAAQILRAFELLAPALMVDFLAENPELISATMLRKWAEERHDLRAAVAALQA